MTLRTERKELAFILKGRWWKSRTLSWYCSKQASAEKAWLKAVLFSRDKGGFVGLMNTPTYWLHVANVEISLALPIASVPSWYWIAI